jgi:PAS domain S-box-containing protein
VADAPIKLLLVEDDLVDKMAFERMVKSEGLPYHYTCVTSVEEAKTALQEAEYDVVVTDYRLGDGTAFDMIAEVPSNTALIIVTGAGGEEVAVQAMKAGASDYLMKDANGNYLKTLPITVDSTLRVKGTEQELKRYHEQLELLVQERTIQLEQKNEELRREIEERKKFEDQLRTAHDKLEARVEQRTSELRNTNEELLQQIAERERAEKGLQKSIETVEAILNATDDCAFLLETDGTFVTLNKPTAALLDRSPEELAGESYFSFVDPDASKTRKGMFDNVVKRGEAVRFEDTGNGRTFDHSYHPVFDSDGTVERVAVFSRDITDQKRSQDMSVQQQRLAALGEMAGGVAHNFNNLLQIVIGASGLAEAELDSGEIEEARKTLSQISENAQMGSQTVRRLQDFARVRTEDPTADGGLFDLSETVQRSIEVTRPLWKTGPEKKGITVNMTRDLVPACIVKGHENELLEVIVNLVKNATEAMSDGGKILAKTFIKEPFVVLQVFDNGAGIPKSHQNKVFEPFFTTKGVQGTGLGLSSSFGIVTRHGGTISVRSREGKGTVFTVQLPYYGHAQGQSDIRQEDTSAVGARILIVDNHPQFVGLMAKALRQFDHTVFKAFSAGDAVKTVVNAKIDMVICYRDLPDGNGWDVADRMRTVCEEKGVPRIPFVLLTKDEQDVLKAQDNNATAVDRVFEKPVQFQLLFKAIKELVLDNGYARN